MSATQTVPLAWPVTVAGRTYDALTIRAPQRPDLTWVQRQRGSDAERALALLARLCGVKLEVIDEMDPLDVAKLDSALGALRGA